VRGKLCPLFYSFFALLLFPITRARAAGEFTAAYDVTYTVSEDATCEVLQRISLTNTTREYYASEHSLSVGKAEITGVWARDVGGPLSPQIETHDGGEQVIKTVFSRPVAGVGKVLTWELGYETDAAEKHGRILRVDLPGIKRQTGVSSYSLKLRVPKSFGGPAYISPTPQKSWQDSTYQVFEFDRGQLEQGGVRAGFGENQVLAFDLSYYLKNQHSQKAYTEIALLPDIRGRQKIIFEQLSPAPEEIRVDEDGNYLAKYLLAPEEELSVDFSGKAVLSYPEKADFPVGMRGDIPLDLVERYTTGQNYWEVESGRIKEKVQALTRPERTVAENARSIYEYVVAHLVYNAARVGGDFERLGAVAALDSRDQALCVEYADLFVTLCRAAGIPARVIDGFAYNDDPELFSASGDVLHSWAEVYLPGVGWWPVDPTWGSTTGGADYFADFDLGHLAFVVKGSDSEAPYPAGTYRWKEDQTGAVTVSFFEGDFGGDDVRLEAELLVPDRALSGWPTEGRLVVKNVGAQSAFEVAVKTVARGVRLVGAEDVDLGTIPPWSTKEVTFRLSRGLFRGSLGQVEVGLGYSNSVGKETGEVLRREVQFIPFWRYFLSWWLLLPLGLVFLGVGAWKVLDIREKFG